MIADAVIGEEAVIVESSQGIGYPDWSRCRDGKAPLEPSDDQNGALGA